MFIFGIDAGHEGVGNGLDPGAVANGFYEANITLAVAKRLKEILLQYKDVQVVMTRENACSNSLSAKSSFFNKYNCNYILSIHVNAGKGTGAEMYIYRRGTKCETYSNQVLTSYIQRTGLVNRGLKEENLHMVRETVAPAGLLELFFIDTLADVQKMASNIEVMAQGISDGYVKAFGLIKKVAPSTPSTNPTPQSGTWRIITGSFGDKKNAEKQMAVVKTKGIDAFVAYYNDLKTYRVIAGSYKEKANAERQMGFIKGKGIECFLAFYKN